jgi:hypothetical protein
VRLCLQVGRSDAVADGGYLLALERSAPSNRPIGSTLVANRSGRCPQAAERERDGSVTRIRTDEDLSQRWLLPAIAAVPGDKGLDRYERSREGLAECVVMCRAIQTSDGGAPESDGITFLHHEALQQIFPVGGQVEVHVIARVHDFFLGLNAGTWLKIRMQQIAQAAEHHMQQNHSTQLASWQCATAEDVLRAGGLAMSRHVEPPPADAAYLFDHWGSGGNAGVSGQRCVPSGVTPDPATSSGGVGGDNLSKVPAYVPWAYQPLDSEVSK